MVDSVQSSNAFDAYFRARNETVDHHPATGSTTYCLSVSLRYLVFPSHQPHAIAAPEVRWLDDSRKPGLAHQLAASCRAARGPYESTRYTLLLQAFVHQRLVAEKLRAKTCCRNAKSIRDVTCKFHLKLVP